MVGLPKISKTDESAFRAASNDQPEAILERSAARQSSLLAQTILDDFTRGFEAIKKLVRSKMELEAENRLLRKGRKRLQKDYDRLLYDRQHDDLTGLYTRQYMMASLSLISGQPPLPHGERRSEEGNCLLMIDLDRFKCINDTHGHQAGDKALQVVAEALIENIRKTDVAARLGGDEFVVILRGAGKRGGQIKVERVQKLFETLCFEWQGLEIPIRASIGCCPIDVEKTADEILKAADEYMYHCKRNKGACRDDLPTSERIYL